LSRRRIDDRAVVRDEYASEERLVARQSIYRASGTDAWTVALRELAAARPRRVLEVGPGTGEFAERMAAELGAEVVALDASPRMVALTRARGIEAREGTVEALPFPDEAFDCAVAAWMLYHVPALDRAIADLARVLRPGGRLVAITTNRDHLAALWSRFGRDAAVTLSFSGENGAALLARAFADVRRVEVRTPVVFEDWAAARRYVAATVTRPHLAERLPRFDGALAAQSSVSVFVADARARDRRPPG
jgi:SAM-dependent methyltransferase